MRGCGGSHPQCFCFVTPVLVDDDEMLKMNEAFMQGEKYTPKGERITEYPAEFKKWVKAHKTDIAKSRSRGTEPYFIRNNAYAIDEILNPKQKELTTLEKVLEIQQGDPMTFEEADALRGNPHYKEDEIYRVNCQSCVVAYEMRRRGFDVEAFGNNKAGDCVPFLLSLKTQLAWLTKDGKIPDLIICKSTVKSKMVDKRGYVRRTYTDNGEVWGELMNKTSTPGRYHLKWKWLNKDSGHIITMETFADGKRRFYDPQVGLEATSIIPWFFKDRKCLVDMKAEIAAYKVDDLLPNADVVRSVVKKAGSSASAPKANAIQRKIFSKNENKSHLTSAFDNNRLSDKKFQKSARNGKKSRLP